MTKVYIPSPLAGYTGQASEVAASGATLAELLQRLDQRYPGIRFRIINEQDQIRRHIKIFVNREQTNDLATALRSTDEVMIVSALSGG